MSMISEQIHNLRSLATETRCLYDDDLHDALIYAADTIEALTAKLQAANEELERWHTDHINENIKNPFAQTSTLICHNCDHKDEYIEELEAADCVGEWIVFGDGLPDERQKVLISMNGKTLEEVFEFELPEKYCLDDELVGFLYGEHIDAITIVKNNENFIMWQPLPESYHEP